MLLLGHRFHLLLPALARRPARPGSSTSMRHYPAVHADDQTGDTRTPVPGSAQHTPNWQRLYESLPPDIQLALDFACSLAEYRRDEWWRLPAYRRFVEMAAVHVVLRQFEETSPSKDVAISRTAAFLGFTYDGVREKLRAVSRARAGRTSSRKKKV